MSAVIKVGNVLPEIRKGRLVDRVYAPRPGTEPAIMKSRLKRALTTGADDVTVRPLAAALTPDERREVLEDIRKSEDVT